MGWDHELLSISEQQWVVICEHAKETSGPFTADSACHIAMDPQMFSDVKVQENWVWHVQDKCKKYCQAKEKGSDCMLKHPGWPSSVPS